MDVDIVRHMHTQLMGICLHKLILGRLTGIKTNVNWKVWLTRKSGQHITLRAIFEEFLLWKAGPIYSETQKPECQKSWLANFVQYLLPHFFQAENYVVVFWESIESVQEISTSTLPSDFHIHCFTFIFLALLSFMKMTSWFVHLNGRVRANFRS